MGGYFGGVAELVDAKDGAEPDIPGSELGCTRVQFPPSLYLQVRSLPPPQISKTQTQNMEIELVKLSPETVFKYKGVTYRSTTMYWTADAAKKACKYQYTGIDSADLAQVVSVVPKYGGRFQPELSVYIDSKTLVEVEP